MDKHNGTLPEERDDVARLLRLAGKRRAVPADRAARVREAARAAWHHQHRRRSRARQLWTAAGLAAAACLVLAITLRPPPGGIDGTAGPESAVLVEALSGAAWARPVSEQDASAPRSLVAGARLANGFELTTAADGRAAVRLTSGHSVRMDSATTLHLLGSTTLALERGAIYIDSWFPDSADESLIVRTALGEVREIGTQFEVRLAERSLLLRLREGTALLIHEDRSHEARAGDELKLGADGTVTRRAIATHGAEWDWIVGVTPMLDLEGRTARQFLEWIARERGWTLAFANEGLARDSGEIVLGGTVARMTLAEALDAVLPACRLSYRVERGVLRVSALNETPPAG